MSSNKINMQTQTISALCIITFVEVVAFMSCFLSLSLTLSLSLLSLGSKGLSKARDYGKQSKTKQACSHVAESPSERASWKESERAVVSMVR
jgi:hypothetical protein